MKRPDPLDILALLGLAVLTVGVGMVFVPAALVVLGSLVLVYAILASRDPAQPKEPTP